MNLELALRTVLPDHDNAALAMAASAALLALVGPSVRAAARMPRIPS